MSKQAFPEIWGGRYTWEESVLGYIVIFCCGSWLATVETYEDAIKYIKQHGESNV